MANEVKVYVVEFGDRPSYQLQWRDPITQKLRTKTTTVKRTGLSRDRKAAERLAGELETQLASGSASLPTKFTWDQFKTRYEAEVVPGLAKETANKISVVFNHVETIISPARLRDLNEARISHFAATIRTSGKAETTIQSYLAHLKAMLRWAVTQKLLPVCPSFPKVQRKKKSKGSTPMKGRPITLEEFERMLEKVPEVVGVPAAPAWSHYLRGLWTSGLRLSESLEMWWDREDRLLPTFPKKGRPMLRIPAELEKGNSDRLLPMAPEFAMFLLETPESARSGSVFKLPGIRGQASELRSKWVGKVVSKIGAAAGVRVHVDPKDPERVKYASAHDMRRAFGERWASRIMPAQLRELMRHESIETTLRYYVGTNAERTADACWDAFEKTGRGAAPAPVVENGVSGACA
jgi:integrase